MNKVIISGANGFIGKKLCHRMMASNRKFIKIIRSHEENDFSEQYICNLGKDKVPDDLFDEVDTIFHLAGISDDAIKNNSLSDSLYFEVNVEATHELAITAEKKGVKRFIFISSVKAGGKGDQNDCMSEIDQFNPDGIYGKSKREAEVKLLELDKKSNMNITIIRPSLVYGKDMKGNLNKMLDGINKGWFPPLPEVGNRRSMIHVDDLVEIILQVENNKKSFGEIFIATDGNLYSSNEIYNAMMFYLKKRVRSWAVPNIFFKLLAKIGNLVNKVYPFPFDSERYQKLLGDECYSSLKLESIIGFKASKNIFTFAKTNYD